MVTADGGAARYRAEILARLTPPPQPVWPDGWMAGERPFRLVVCGSRHWPASHRWVVEGVLERRLLGLPAGVVLEVVDGACPAGGVDVFAHEWAVSRRSGGAPVVSRRVPADWSLGRRAGPQRNERMVKDADLVEGFLFGRSCGTVDCLLWSFAHGVERWGTALWGDGSVTRQFLDGDLMETVKGVHLG